MIYFLVNAGVDGARDCLLTLFLPVYRTDRVIAVGYAKYREAGKWARRPWVRWEKTWVGRLDRGGKGTHQETKVTGANGKDPWTRRPKRGKEG